MFSNRRKKRSFWRPGISMRFISRHTISVGVFLVICLVVCAYVVFSSIAPTDFPRNTIIRIQKDMTVSEVASLLQDKGLIRSRSTYKAYVTILHRGKGVQAGSFLFDQPQSALRIAYRTAYGVDELHKVKVTIPEGSNSKEIGAIIERAIPAFDLPTFLSEAKKSEGYLFPETYFFNPDVTPREVISMMKEQFGEKVGTIMNEIATSTHPMEEILIMASILEEEANNPRDRALISGVLWNRIKIDMPLQVDAPFYYIFNKGSSQLTLTDLATSSKYNTYKNKGFPLGPISNPGLGAIKAALYPEKTKYLFYLADRSGVTHYAVTHDEHVANKAKYLQ